jgi:hypothetical protein
MSESRGYHPQLSAIGGSMQGRSHWILTGSSSCLRSFIFGKLPKDQAERFPNYKGIDLNSTKFIPVNINPLLSTRDLRTFWKVDLTSCP